MDKDLERLKLQKQTIKEQIVSTFLVLSNSIFISLQIERQQKVKQAGDTSESVESVGLYINTLAVEIQDKKDRLEKLRATVASANYEARLVEFTKTGRGFEERREELNVELQSLTLQADTRARLDLKRTEIKTKSVEVQNK